MKLDRRDFLLAVGGGLAGLGLIGAHAGAPSAAQAAGPGWEPGIEEHLNSTCLVCPSRCGIRGRVVDGRLVRIGGNPLHPLNRGGLCPRGAAAVQTLHRPERLRSPLVRTGPRGEGGWREISWPAALDSLVERLRQLRGAGHPEALAVLAGYCAGSMDELWRRFLRAYGSPNYCTDAYDDGIEGVMAAMHGIAQRPAYDLERAGLVLSFGAPLFEAWWSPLQAQVAFGRPAGGRAERPRFVQVDTRFSATAARAHEWVGVRPETHAILALGIAYVLIKEERIDGAFLAEHVSGFEDWTDRAGTVHEGYRSIVLRNYRTEEVSAATGVSVERIVGLARSVSDHRPTLAVCGTDVTLSPDGLVAGMAVHSLNVLLGSISRPGGVLFPDQPPLQGFGPETLDPVARRGLAHTPVGAPAPFGAESTLPFAEALASADRGALEVLLVYYANPLSASPRPDTWTAALERVPLVVSFSPFADETTRHADLVLPDLLPPERWQDGPSPSSYPFPAWGIARPLVVPPPGGMSAGDAVLQVAQRLGGSVAASLRHEDFAALLKARARGLFDAKRGMPFGDEFETTHQRQMEERGWWLGEHADFEAFWNALLERGGWTDPFYDAPDPGRRRRSASGKIDLMPVQVQRHLASARRPTGLYLFAAGRDESGSRPPEYPLRLLPYRVSTLASGTLGLTPWVAERPTTLHDIHWIPWVEVHPDTARELGLANGAMAWVISPRGHYRARVKHFVGTARDTLAAPYGPRHPDGSPANPLHLLDGAADSLTGLPSWSSTFVRLERA